jgi:hypothetical protein
VSQISATDREYDACTADQLVWARSTGSGQLLGVQIEEHEMSRPGPQIAARIQACADVAYLEGQLAVREESESRGAPKDSLSFMPVRRDLEAARARLGTL